MPWREGFVPVQFLGSFFLIFGNKIVAERDNDQWKNKNQNKRKIEISHYCIGQEKSDYDPFIPEHAVSFIINGTMEITEADKRLSFSEGNVVFISKIKSSKKESPQLKTIYRP